MRTAFTARSRTLLAALAASMATGLAAAEQGGRSSAAARYEVERAACLRGHSAQDTATCLREAAAARAQAGHERSQDEDRSRWQANQQRRCEPLPQALRRDCEARMQGEGTVSGSVAGGGMLRELVTEIDSGDGDGDGDGNAAQSPLTRP